MMVEYFSMRVKAGPHPTQLARGQGPAKMALTWPDPAPGQCTWACYAFVSFNMFVFNSHPRVIQQVGIGHWASCTSMLLNMAVLSSPWPRIIRHSAVGLLHLRIVRNVRLGSGAGVC